MLVLSHNHAGVALLYFEQPWTEAKNKSKLLNPLITSCHRVQREGTRLQAPSVVEPDKKPLGPSKDEDEQPTTVTSALEICPPPGLPC